MIKNWTAKPIMHKLQRFESFMVAIRERIIPHKMVDEYKACKKLFFQAHARINRVIEAIGMP